MAGVELTVPEREVLILPPANAGGPQIPVVDPDALPAREELAPLLGLDTRGSASPLDPPFTRRVPSVSLLTAGELLWALGSAVFLLRLAALLFLRRLRRWARPVRSPGGALRAAA